MPSPTHPALNPQVIGQAESALGALLTPVLAEAGRTFPQWVVLAVMAASNAPVDRGDLVDRIIGARKLAPADAEAAVTELTDGGSLACEAGQVELTAAGRITQQRIRDRIEEVTAGLFDFPEDDLATAGRVLAAVTARANAFLARHPAR